MVTSIKKKVHICTTPPATKTLAAYQAATWVQVKGVVSVGDPSFPHATIEVPELETGITKTYKGARTGAAAELAWQKVEGDPGQAALVTANENEAEVSLRIDSPDGTSAKFYTGIFHSLKDNDSDVSSYEGGTGSFVPNYAPVSGAPTSGG